MDELTPNKTQKQLNLDLFSGPKTAFISALSNANLRRSRAGGGGQFLFSRRLYDVNKGEESSLCDLLLDNERDSGAGTSLCGSSTGSSSQRRRASLPQGLHHHPAHPIVGRSAHPQPLRQHHTAIYRPHTAQLGTTASAAGAVVRRSPRRESQPKTNLPIATGQQTGTRRAVLLEVRDETKTPSPISERHSSLKGSTSTLQQPKQKVIIGEGKRGAPQKEEKMTTPITVSISSSPKHQQQMDESAYANGETGVLGKPMMVNGHSRQVFPSSNGDHPTFFQPSSSGTTVIPLRPEPVEATSSAQHQQLSSPTVFINMGRRNTEQRRVEEGRSSRSEPRLLELGEHGHLRKWRAHAGRNRFFCDGRLVMARQSSIFLLTLFLILITMALFCFFDLPYLTEHVSVAIPIVSGTLFLFVISALFKTAFSDPGIVPRASPREVLEWERQCQDSDPFFSAEEWAQPRTRLVHIRGQPVKLKYCFTCCIFRPPRSSHCSVCDNCVLNFDHHCPWVGNCIGLRNYRHFYLFITSLSLLDAFMGVSVGIHIYLLTSVKGGFVGAVRETPFSLLTGLINVISIWSVLGLSGFHTYLIALGQTTNEDIKGTFSRKLHPQVKNPYSTGNCFKNIVDVLCAPERPSLLDRRGWLPPETGPTIYVDKQVLDALTDKKRQREHNELVAAGSMLTLRNGESNRSVEERRRRRQQQRAAGRDGASPSSSCPPSPPRQHRRSGNKNGSLQRVIIPLSTHSLERINNGDAQNPQRNNATTHRIYHGNNLVAPMEDTFSATVTRSGKGRRSVNEDGGRTPSSLTVVGGAEMYRSHSMNESRKEANEAQKQCDETTLS